MSLLEEIKRLREGDEIPGRCGLCGEVMPRGYEMFKYHGFNGPCPKPPLERKPKLTALQLCDALEKAIEFLQNLDSCAIGGDRRHLDQAEALLKEWGIEYYES